MYVVGDGGSLGEGGIEDNDVLPHLLTAEGGSGVGYGVFCSCCCVLLIPESFCECLEILSRYYGW